MTVTDKTHPVKQALMMLMMSEREAEKTEERWGWVEEAAVKWRKPHTHTANTDVVCTKLCHLPTCNHIYTSISCMQFRDVQRLQSCIFSLTQPTGTVYPHVNSVAELKRICKHIIVCIYAVKMQNWIWILQYFFERSAKKYHFSKSSVLVFGTRL